MGSRDYPHPDDDWAYSDLIRLRIDADTLNPQFAQWYQARSDRDINAKAQVKVRQYYQNRLDHIEEALRADC